LTHLLEKSDTSTTFDPIQKTRGCSKIVDNNSIKPIINLSGVMYQTEVDVSRCKNDVGIVGRTKKTTNFEKFRNQLGKEMQVWKTNISLRNSAEISFTTGVIFDKVQTGQVRISIHVWIGKCDESALARLPLQSCIKVESLLVTLRVCVAFRLTAPAPT
jgi:hypothetical protein